MAAEIDAREPPSEWAAIRVTLRGLQVMLARAEWAAATAGLNKGAVRKAPPDEVSLVAALHRLYADVTGDKRWHTINVNNGAPGGPFVDFVMAVAAHIHDHLDNAMDPPAPEAFANNIKTLSTSPRRVAKRIGLARKILKT